MNAQTQETQETQIRIGGYGGQGIVLAGKLLGKAASLYDSKEAVFTQAYGPEARGGASNADVIISNQTIDYPYVTQADILVVLFQEAYEKFIPILHPNGLLIIEEDLVQPHQACSNQYALPATRIAKELGNKLVTNVVVFGYLVGLTGTVSVEAAKQAITGSVKSKVIELNILAFDAGYQRAKEDRNQ